MVRRYEEPIEVRAAARQSGTGAAADDAPAAPEVFVWRGRLYVVRAVLGHWQERRPWWRDALETAGPDEPRTSGVPGQESRGAQAVVPVGVLDSARERQVWRVEASAGRMAGSGVYDLVADRSPRQWRLLRVAD